LINLFAIFFLASASDFPPSYPTCLAKSALLRGPGLVPAAGLT